MVSGIQGVKMKIKKLKEGDTIPEGAKFLKSTEEKEVIGRTVKYDHGIFFTDRYTITEYEMVTYFYYEVDDE